MMREHNRAAGVGFPTPIMVGVLLGLLGTVGCGGGYDSESSEEADPINKQGEAQAALVGGSSTFAAAADSQIGDQVPPKNFGASTVMNSGEVAGRERQSLLRFDTSIIPHAQQIISATLTVYHNNNTDGVQDMQVHKITAPWTEMGVTWQNFGGAYDAADESPGPNFTAAPGGAGDMAFRVDGLVQQWVIDASSNNGALLEHDGGAGNVRFHTKEWPFPDGTQPELSVEWADTCTTNWLDIDGNAANGCECNAPVTGAACPGASHDVSEGTITGNVLGAGATEYVTITFSPPAPGTSTHPRIQLGGGGGYTASVETSCGSAWSCNGALAPTSADTVWELLYNYDPACGPNGNCTNPDGAPPTSVLVKITRTAATDCSPYTLTVSQ